MNESLCYGKLFRLKSVSERTLSAEKKTNQRNKKKHKNEWKLKIDKLIPKSLIIKLRLLYEICLSSVDNCSNWYNG